MAPIRNSGSMNPASSPLSACDCGCDSLPPVLNASSASDSERFDYEFQRMIQDFASARLSQEEDASGRSRATKTQLHVFDFDSTLFRTPLPSAALWSGDLRGSIISDCAWFCDSRTLSSPFVPEHPDASWWDPYVVNAAIAAHKDPSSVVVLLTGRRRDLFNERIEQLCKLLADSHNSGEPIFDFVFLKELPASANVPAAATLDFKWCVLTSMFDAFPNIEHIEIWDDRPKHLALFEKRLIAMGRPATSLSMHSVVQDANLTKVGPEDVEIAIVLDLVGKCNAKILAAEEREKQQQKADDDESEEVSGSKKTKPPPPRKSISSFRTQIQITETVQYTGIFLDEASTSALLAAVPMPQIRSDDVNPQIINYAVKADHVTVSLGQAPPDVLQALGGLNACITMRAIAWGSTPGNVVVAVKVEHEANDLAPASVVDNSIPIVLSTNATPHCTLYVSNIGKARQSNDITDWRPFDSPISISGILSEKKVFGTRKSVAKIANASAAASKKDVSLGTLVKKYHPHLKGREIGEAVKRVQDWMETTFMDNVDGNLAPIEMYVSQMFELAT
ncbi:hypothetical protein HDU83_008595 [Entophlyctis luteolus]|nr:hypothetical protein HDU83_008595 [Entophlyctis luteolus]